MNSRYLFFALLPTLAFAQDRPSFRAEVPANWFLSDGISKRWFPKPQIVTDEPSATVIVEDGYPPLFTEREIRLMEFRAWLLADLKHHLDSNAPAPPRGAGTPAGYGEHNGPRLVPFGRKKW